jgi:membrane-associated phospholipid phosphatase
MPRILKNGIFALALCSVLVVLCFFFIDKPVAFWVYQHQLSQYRFLKWFTHIPEFFYSLTLFVYLFFIVQFAYHKRNYFSEVMLAMANSIVIATLFKTILKVIFGRYWPLTWKYNNLSLIKNNAYGFNFFKGFTTANNAFPSGHTAVIVAAISVLWIAYPRWRWLYSLLVFITVIGMLGMNYHFVGDVIGGAFLGALVGYYVVIVSNLKKYQGQSSNA